MDEEGRSESKAPKKAKKAEQDGSEFQVSHFEDIDSSLEHSCLLKREKRQKIKSRKTRTYMKMNHFQWSIEQEQKFLTFMLQNQAIFQDKQERRRHKIFKQMAKFVATRSSEQCRSHHQKYEQRCDSFQNIVLFIREKMHEDKMRLAELPQPKLAPPQPHLGTGHALDRLVKKEANCLGDINKKVDKKTRDKNQVMGQNYVPEGSEYEVLSTRQRGVTILGLPHTCEFLIKINMAEVKFMEI